MSDRTLSDLLERAADRVPDSAPPVADLVARGRTAVRRRRVAAVSAAVAAVLVLGGGAASLTGEDDHAQPSGPSQRHDTSPPAPPSGMKWVGIGREVVAVPRAWPVLPGVYCGEPEPEPGPGSPYVDLTQWNVVVMGCVDGPAPQPTIGLSADPAGRVHVSVANAVGIGLTRRSVTSTRTTLPDGWLAVPAGLPAGRLGPWTAVDEIDALETAGFRVVRRQVPAHGNSQHVTTDPEVGTPARVGTTVVVVDHGRVASSATLRGRLTWVGGPPPGSPVAHPGTVHVFDRDRYVDLSARAHPDGSWHVRVPPGTYQVRATSPGFGSREGAYDGCRADREVTVDAHQIATVDVTCELR